VIGLRKIETFLFRESGNFRNRRKRKKKMAKKWAKFLIEQKSRN